MSRAFWLVRLLFVMMVLLPLAESRSRADQPLVLPTVAGMERVETGAASSAERARAGESNQGEPLLFEVGPEQRAATIRLGSGLPATIEAGPQAMPLVATVASPALNLREGPGTTFAVVAPVPQGTELPIRSILADGSWVEVEWNGRTGWVYAPYLILPGDVE